MKPFASILLISILLLASMKLSSNNSLVKGRGSLRTEFRTTTPFSKIDSRIKADINIIKSKIRNISITAQENIVPLIDLTERNGILVISTGSYEYISDSTIIITIYVPAIVEICLSGSGTICSECPAGSLKITGNGVISCTGNTTQASIEISGNGKINLQAMKLKNCTVNITGIGIVNINVSGKLNILIPGSGTVHYTGYPEICSSVSGDGCVIWRK